MLTDIVVVTLQYVQISNQYVVHSKIIQMMSVIPIYAETIHMQKLHKYFLKVKKECERKSYIRRN